MTTPKLLIATFVAIAVTSCAPFVDKNTINGCEIVCDKNDWVKYIDTYLFSYTLCLCNNGASFNREHMEEIARLP